MATSCEELTHWIRLWCWERLGAGVEGDDRGWDGWMASLTRWMWVCVNSGSWWWTGRPGMLWFMGLQRVGQDWVTDLIWYIYIFFFNLVHIKVFSQFLYDFFLTLWLLSNLHICDLPVFLLLLVSNFIALYLEKICWIISVSFLKILFGLILWSNIWSVQKNIPCALEERYPIFLKWKVLYMFKSYIL